MTDITDDELRAAREWAWLLTRPALGAPEAGSDLAAARYILATVDAPAPTLSEELLTPDGRDEDVDGETWIFSPERMKNLADRVAQMEHDLTEARAEVERLTARASTMQDEIDQTCDDVKKYNTAIAKIGMLESGLELKNREVERLTEDNTQLGMFLAVARTSKNSLPVVGGEYFDDLPANIPAGEAWSAIHEGSEVTAVRKAGLGGAAWVVVRSNGDSGFAMLKDVTLVSRLVPAPRVITDPDELEKLTATSIIRDGRGWPGGVTDQGVTMINGFCVSDEEVISHGPVTVLWEPEA